MQPDVFDLTVIIDFIFARIGYAVTWAQTHSVQVHEYVFTFFDIFMGTATLTLILSYIPGWEDMESELAECESDPYMDEDDYICEE